MTDRGSISGESTATTVTGKTEEPGFDRALSLRYGRGTQAHRARCDDWDVHPLTLFRSQRTNRNRANQRSRILKQRLMPPPSNHSDDDNRGDKRLPSLGVKIEARAFELKIMHDTALH